MTAHCFKRVKKFSQRYKDIVYGYIKQTQRILPSNDNSFFIIDHLIQDLCLLYFCACIDTKILTEDEQMKLLKMVGDHTNNEYKDYWKLLYRRSRDGITRDDFYAKCDQMDNLICIVQTPQQNVFGGFTRIKWDKTKDECVDDLSAFIYSIRSEKGLPAKIYPYCEPSDGKEGHKAVRIGKNSYLNFNNEYAFYFWHSGVGYAERWKDSEEFNLHGYVLNGMGRKYDAKEVEVYQLFHTVD